MISYLQNRICKLTLGEVIIIYMGRNQYNKKVYLRVIVAFVLLIVLVSIIIYKLPKEINLRAKAIAQNNPYDIVDIELSLEVWKYVFQPTKVEGYITFGDVQYNSMVSLGYDVFESRSFIEKLSLKLNGETYHIFTRADLIGNQIKMLEDTIILTNISDDYIEMIKFDEKRGSEIYMIVAND